MFRALALTWGLVLSVSAAHAGYFVAVYGNRGFQAGKATHYVVAGNGSELNTLFQYAAASKGLKLQQLYPQDQVVLIAYNQSPGSTKNHDQINSWGYQIVGDRSQLSFTPARLIQEFLQARQIASIDLYAHNAGLYGSSLEDGSHRISQDNVEITQIKRRLTANAYAILHGCNTGFYFAPAWSRLLGIPVAGSFTSTKFERLHSSGAFYSYQDDLMPTTGSWTSTNALSFSGFSPSCDKAGCLRMKPDNWPYTGMWGDYNAGGGLPMFKFFCVSNDTFRCQKAMAESVLGFISTKSYGFKLSYSDYKNLVKDFLCPIDAKSNIREACSAALDRAESTGSRSYSPYQGKLLTCTWQGCYAQITCDSDASGYVIAKSCTVQNQYASSTAFVDEYLAYLQGYQYLNQPNRGGSLFHIW